MTIRGERVRGTVRLTGSSRMEVRIDSPFSGKTANSAMSFFSRVPPGEPGYLGQYGEALALRHLENLYEEERKERRRFHRSDWHLEQLGQIRYVEVAPGHRSQDRMVRGETAISDEIYVRMEDDGRYAYMRFFDVSSKQPFLGEAGVCDDSLQQYVEALKADLNFQNYIRNVRDKRLAKMLEITGLLRDSDLTIYQASFLGDFGRVWREGRLPLVAAELEQLIERGYLIRDSKRASSEKSSIEAAIERSHKALNRFEAAGNARNAAQSRARLKKLQNRLDVKQLMITALGKKIASSFPYLVDTDDDSSDTGW